MRVYAWQNLLERNSFAVSAMHQTPLALMESIECAFHLDLFALVAYVSWISSSTNSSGFIRHRLPTSTSIWKWTSLIRICFVISTSDQVQS